MRRKRIVRLSEDADRGWKTYADLHHVSVTALLEALGLHLAGNAPLNAQTMRAVLDQARAIDAARRQRGTGD